MGTPTTEGHDTRGTRCHGQRGIEMFQAELAATAGEIAPALNSYPYCGGKAYQSVNELAHMHTIDCEM
jgi:hypothetical protein